MFLACEDLGCGRVRQAYKKEAATGRRGPFNWGLVVEVGGGCYRKMPLPFLRIYLAALFRRFRSRAENLAAPLYERVRF